MNNKLNFAKMIVSYSCKIKSGETVYINFKGYSEEILNLIINEIHKVGANVIVRKTTPVELHELIRTIKPKECLELLKYDLNDLSKSKVYISLLEDIDIVDISLEYEEQLKMYNKLYSNPFRTVRLNNCRWLGLRLPSHKLAKKFNMSLINFEEYYYKVCGLNYIELKKEYDELKNNLSNARHVYLKSPDTNFEFEKDNMEAVILCGEKNLPDGEIYTSPIKTSPNGIIKFNTKSFKRGYNFSDIKLEFKNGEVVDFDSNNNQLLEKILNTDSGSKYIGEFAIGINPFIDNPSGIILYDEKIYGSIHLALGQSYNDAYNGNDSIVHWDLVKLLTPNFGYGKLYLDDKLTIDDGKIVKEKGR
ncbi:MAG: aminopeptidase [Bacilli bacterium]|nr:aminopeptidase [Bacilli bacterium]